MRVFKGVCASGCVDSPVAAALVAPLVRCAMYYMVC